MSCCFNHQSLIQDTYLHGKGRGFNHKYGYRVGNFGIYSVTIFIPLERHVSSRMSTTSVAMQLLTASHYLRYRTALSLKSSDTHKQFYGGVSGEIYGSQESVLTPPIWLTSNRHKPISRNKIKF